MTFPVMALTLSLLLKSSVLSVSDYCKLTCKNRKIPGAVYENVACKCLRIYPRCDPLSIKLWDFRRWILEIHNELRQKIALGLEEMCPYQAANMHTLNYDLSLETTALCHVKLCSNMNDECRRTEKWYHVSQSIAQMATKKVLTSEWETKQLIIDWYNQMKSTNLSTDSSLIDSFRIPTHSNSTEFTPIISAETTHIGCARAYDTQDHNNKSFFLTCNYAPAGNQFGLPLYKRGEPCSKCEKPEKCNEKYHGLCGNITVEGRFAGAEIIKSKILFFIILINYFI